jgi:peptidoglycan/xylan/chitin deacetylase (PgdA/CDA1 family)
MFYVVKTPEWVIKLNKSSTWKFPETGKKLYLTFDDGPHPQITSFVLDELKKFNAKASFFCLGKNVVENPLIFNRIIGEGHAIGNHTYDHLDGWKTGNLKYLQNISEARKSINSDLFRPPYGRITPGQQKKLLGLDKPYKIIMWSILSGDFDVNISAVQCCNNVLKNAKSGSVIVFHDSEKAFDRLKYTLPVVLKYFSEKGFQFEKIATKT